MTALAARRDALLGTVTMYRLLTLALLALAGYSVALALLGVLDPAVFAPAAMLATLAVLVAASVGASLALGRLWGVTPHTESAVITALILYFLYWPTLSPAGLGWLAGAAVLANLSKYVLAFRGRHVLNPAAAGAVLLAVVQAASGVAPADRVGASWWVAGEAMAPAVLVGALLVLHRTRRLAVGAVFVAVSGVLVVAGLAAAGIGWPDALRFSAYSYPLVFLAGFMLSEPLTLPPRRWQQLSVAALVGLLVALPTFAPAVGLQVPRLGWLSLTPEVALAAGNAVAFLFGQRRAVRMTYLGRRQLTPTVVEFAFAPHHRVRFAAGQYLELTLPHRADARGTRRVFSFSSPPGNPGLVTVAVKVPDRPSSFKAALLALEPGAVVRATGVGGDFVAGGGPALLVAGGIGVTPFASQALEDPGRDAVLVYGVASCAELAYRDELAGTAVVVVSPDLPGQLPPGWRHVQSAAVTAEVLGRAVPDLAARTAYVSGPPAMVDAVRRSLRGVGVRRVRTDHFTGY